MFLWIARSGTTQAVAPIPGALGQSYAFGAGSSWPTNTRDAAELVFDVNLEPGAYDVLYLDSVPGDNRGVTTFDVYATPLGGPTLFSVRRTPLELTPRHHSPSTPPASPARPHSPFSPPSPAHTPADRCPLACTARRSPPRP